MFKFSKTDRGFNILTFNDLNNIPCSLQESSLATEEAIWLGQNKSNKRMHLTREQVRNLLSYLQHFVEKGEIIPYGGVISKDMKERLEV